MLYTILHASCPKIQTNSKTRAPGRRRVSSITIVESFLDPDDQVFELVEDSLASREDLAHVAPVHADVVNRAVDTMLDQPLEGTPKNNGGMG